MNKITHPIGLLVAIAGLASCSADPDSETSIESGAAALPATADQQIHGIGYIEPAGEIRRLTFRHPGIIAEVAVEEGEQVKEGQGLVRLRSAEEQAQVAIAHAELAAAQAELKRVMAGAHPAQIDAAKAAHAAAEAEQRYRQSEFDRQRDLAEAKASTTANLDSAHSRHEQAVASLAATAAEVDHLIHMTRSEDQALAEAQVEVAKAKLTAAETLLAETELLAPMAGQILDLLQRAGDAATGSGADPVCLLGDTSHLVVRAEIDENFALALRPGQVAEIILPGPGGQILHGTVSAAKPVMGRKTVFSRSSNERRDLDVRQVVIELENATAVPVGLKVDVRIDTGKGGRR